MESFICTTFVRRGPREMVTSDGPALRTNVWCSVNVHLFRPLISNKRLCSIKQKFPMLHQKHKRPVLPKRLVVTSIRCYTNVQLLLSMLRIMLMSYAQVLIEVSGALKGLIGAHSPVAAWHRTVEGAQPVWVPRTISPMILL